MADRDLRKTGIAAKACRRFLMLGIFPRMHEDDGDRIDAGGLGRLDLALHGVEVEFRFHRAVDTAALRHLDHALIELFGKNDLLGEDVGPRLIGDLQCIAKASGDEKRYAVALALQKRIGRHGRAHFHVANQVRRHGFAGLDAEMIANALNAGIGIGFRIFRKQLAGKEPAIGGAADNVGKGAAAVDPKIPFAFCHHRFLRIILGKRRTMSRIKRQ